ncbi:MAG: hypothetical protein GTO55_11815 [Armatimonadetes bacterium]|nr:hypothetical protein [Armatimonadota bacterium]NIM24898.1 hypothetical protein [Armatimonadota bacterium]NIM68789.1 hypothetical protein [Armatimonadota bacterium]NIN06984.1 hypothetical protein [Armatimonadota bacterium]NIO98888.1 hypothetical protein [Armatimonadota bacterium]
MQDTWRPFYGPKDAGGKGEDWRSGKATGAECPERLLTLSKEAMEELAKLLAE